MAVFVSGARRRAARKHSRSGEHATTLRARQHRHQETLRRKRHQLTWKESRARLYPRLSTPTDDDDVVPLSEALASVALQKLRGGKPHSAFPAKALQRHLGYEVANVVRAEVQAAGSTVSSASMLYPSEKDLAAQGFLARMWACLSRQAREPSNGGLTVKGAARLLGDVVGSIPAEEARNQLGQTLAKMVRAKAPTQAQVPKEAQEVTGMARAFSTASPVLKEMMAKELAECLCTIKELEGTRHVGRRQSTAKYVMNILAKGVSKEVSGCTAATVLAVIARAEPNVLLLRNAAAYRACLEQLEPGHVREAKLWKALQDAPPRLQLMLMEHLARKFGGVEAWEASGGHMAKILKVCAAEGASDAAPVDVGMAQTQLQRLWASVAHHPGRVQALELKPEQSLMLARHYGNSMGLAAEHVLRPVLKDMLASPTRYSESDYVAVANALDVEHSQRTCWHMLAKAYAEQLMEPVSNIASSLDGLTDFLLVTPPELEEPVAMRIQETGLLQYIPNERLVQLLRRWASPAVEKDRRQAGREPLLSAGPFRTAVVDAFSKNLAHVEAKALVTTSQLLEDSCPSMDAMLISWWQHWMEETIYTCICKQHWQRCFDALEGARSWNAARDPSDPGMSMTVFRYVVQRLGYAGEFLPLNLMLELTQVPELEEEESKRLMAKLVEAVRSHLRGERGCLPLVTAVAIANGETPVTFDEGSKQWQALVMSVASQVQEGKVDLFCRCRPSSALIEAIMRELPEGSWERLELAFHTPSEDSDEK